MQVHHCRTAEHLVERLVTLWSGPRQDPFAFDLAVVPGPGFQRWLSQQLLQPLRLSVQPLRWLRSQ